MIRVVGKRGKGSVESQMDEAARKLFTKSAFKVALTCPAQLYYYYDGEHYANQNVDDEFLKALAEGGFQVGELAKVYCGVTDDRDLGGLSGYEKPLARTAELLASDRAVVAEAAFKFENLFVRADIVRRNGDCLDLIEVKAKSWETGKPFTKIAARGDYRGKEVIDGDIRDYVYDVAFQKYVVAKAMPNLRVRAFLMLADKTKTADVAGVNQCFRICHRGGRTTVERTGDWQGLANHEHILTAFDVDEVCDKIIGDRLAAQRELLGGLTFGAFVTEMARRYCEHEQQYCNVTTVCYSCPFYTTKDDPPEKLDGYRECWRKKAGFTDGDFERPLLKELWGGGNTKLRGNLFRSGKYFLDDISAADIGATDSGHDKGGLDHCQRKILQIGITTNSQSMLADFQAGMQDADTYLDVEGLKAEMATWKYPLHMIDFETSCVALPFYAQMKPYEQIAFQFSHHTIAKDGTIAHAGQYINMKRGFFPNFEFVRKLKAELEKDGGTVFRYATHENSILNAIRRQLLESDESDRNELVAFIETITHRDEVGRGRIVGPRDMVDLCDIVRRYYYHRSMKGSNSIKAVLPAVLNSSKRIQEKYSRPIYGGDGEIRSCNIVSPEAPRVWVTMEKDAKGNPVVANPYKKLPAVSSYFPVDAKAVESYIERHGDEGESGIENVNNGGAALSAYGLIQFAEEDSDRAKALESALLRYCELDTLAMVFVWEFLDEIISKRR